MKILLSTGKNWKIQITKNNTFKFTLNGLSTSNIPLGSFNISLLIADSSVVFSIVTPLLLPREDILLIRIFPTSSIFSLNPLPMERIASSVAESRIGLSNPATPILKPSNPSCPPLTVNTGALAYAFATLRFRSSTMIFAHISSSILSHFSITS